MVLCLHGAIPSNAQTPENTKATIKGRVVDDQKLPIPKATVVLNNDLNGSSDIQTASDDGLFEFANVASGSYSLTIKSEGFASRNRRLTTEPGGVLALGDVTLPIVGINQSVTVVSASRVEELQEDSPVNTLAIGRQEIQNTGYERVGDVLSEVPGVVTRAQSYGVRLPGGEQINGVDSRQVLVLQDGLPIVGARGITEGVIDLNQQEVGRLDRVEVVEGAASALYGSDAIGGVVNLITREPTQPLDLNASLSGGSLGAIDGRLDMGTKWKNLSAFLALGEHKIDSYTLLPSNPSTIGPDEDRQNIAGRLRYTFSPRVALGFTGSAYHAHDLALSAGTDPFSRRPYQMHNRANDSNQSYALIGDFLPTNSTMLQVRLYNARFDQNSQSNLVNNDGTEGPAFDLANLNERYHRADTTIGQQTGSWQYLQGGFEWAQDLYRGVNRLVSGNAGDQITTNDLWFQDRIQPFRRFTITLGGRYQHHSLYGGHLVPKVGLVYRATHHLTLRAAFGGGFRAPDLGQLYYRLLHLDYGYQVIGNPSLRPETSQSYSAGGTYSLRRFQLGLNLFRNNLNHLIDTFLACDETTGQDCSGASLNQRLQQYGVPPSFQYDATGAAFFTFIYRNVNRAYTQGFNANTQIALTKDVRVLGSYTYLEAVDFLNHVWLPYRSRHQGHAAIEYANRHWGLMANLRGNFFSGWPTETSSGDAFGYQTWNSYVSQKLGRGFQLFAAVYNLADSTDPKLHNPKPSFDRADYGRTFRVGLRYSLIRHE
jgi:outer membrane receptor for ferrienterochelin and colicins